MLLNLPVVRSVGARFLFIGSALVTVAILLWSNGLSMVGPTSGLTPMFVYLFTVMDYAGANCALLILLAALFVPERYSFRPLLRWIGEHPGVVATASALMLCAGALLVYRNHPLSMDEFSALFQSQVFAAGRLTGQFPTPLLDWLVPPLFQDYFLDVSHATGQVASAYWPSFALLLTPFTALGIPWACNPLISALTLLVIHRLGLRIFADTETAGLAVLLTAASPVFFANGISYYSMPAHLLANAVYALLLIDPTPRRACAAGLVGSVALTLHNPVPHMLFAFPWIIWLAKRPGSQASVGWLIAGYLPLCLLLGLGWFVFLGNLMHQGSHLTNAAATSDDLMRVGSAFAPPSATLLVARLIGIAKIWVWAVPGLLLLAAAGAWKWRHDTCCRLLITSASVTLLGFLLVPTDQGHGWGFRYFHSAWLVLPLLAAGALARRPATHVSNNPVQDADGRLQLFEDPATRTFVVACALITLVAANCLRAIEIRDLITRNERQVPAYTGTEHQVVIIDPRLASYGQDLVRNDPWLRGTVVRMISHGAAADGAVLHKYYPNLQRVYADRYGAVWSAATPRSGAVLASGAKSY